MLIGNQHFIVYLVYLCKSSRFEFIPKLFHWCTMHENINRWETSYAFGLDPVHRKSNADRENDRFLIYLFVRTFKTSHYLSPIATTFLSPTSHTWSGYGCEDGDHGNLVPSPQFDELQGTRLIPSKITTRSLPNAGKACTVNQNRQVHVNPKTKTGRNGAWETKGKYFGRPDKK